MATWFYNSLIRQDNIYFSIMYIHGNITLWSERLNYTNIMTRTMACTTTPGITQKGKTPYVPIYAMWGKNLVFRVNCSLMSAVIF